MGRFKNARLMIVISMFIFGTLGLLVRNISVTSGELALYRAVMASVLLGVYFLVTKQKIEWKRIGKELPLLIISGMAMGVNWILLFEAYKYTTVSIATLSYYFAPVLVTVACPVLFREKMGWKEWLCFAMSTLGIVLITGVGDLGSGSSHLTGIAFGLGAAVLYASVVMLNKYINGVSGIQRTFLQFVSAVVILVPYVWCTSGATLHTMDGTGWICLAIIGLVHTGLAYCLYFSALKDIPGQEAAILSYVDPLVAVMISVFILGEDMTAVQIIGGALILGFTLWNEIRPKKS